MSSFRFNFDSDSSVGEAACLAVGPSSLTSGNFLASELPFSTEVVHSSLETVQLPDRLCIYKGCLPSQIASEIPDLADLPASDLIPNKYEGGFKLWECSLDLASYLAKLYCSAAASLPLRNRSVLELGCGHGIPGILMAILGAQVHFQDYNREVLERVTMPNYAANLQQLASDSEKRQPRFFAGSWQSLGLLLTQLGLAGTYDFVLTTDTIYSPASQQHLIDCMLQALKPGGVAYVGAKSYYFGVGGSTQAFTAAVLKSGQFDVEVVDRIQDGASNVREIIRLRKC